MPAAAWGGDKLTPLMPWQEESALAALHDPSAAVQQTAVAWLSDKQLSSEPLVDAVASYMRPGEPPETRQQAAKVLQNRGAKAARFSVQLVALLRDPEHPVRQAAADALYAIGAAAAPVARQLGALLQDKDSLIRFYAVVLLGNMPAEAARFAPRITSLLGDPNADVRRGALDALGAMGPAGATHVEEVFSSLGDGAEFVSIAAARALCRMGPAASPMVPRLVRHLKEPDAGFRRRMIEVLGNLVCLGAVVTDAAPQIAPLLADANPGVRRAAASTLLGQMASAAAPFASRFPALLRDSSQTVREVVAQELPHLGLAAAALAPQLVPLLKDKSPDIRRAAVSALGGLGPAAAAVVPQLAGLLKHPDADVRAATAEVLGHMGPAAAVTAPRLVQLLADRDVGVAAQGALAALGPAALPVVPQLAALATKRFDYRVQVLSIDAPDPSRRAASALGSMGAAAALAVPELAAALKEKRSSLYVLNALEALGPVAAAAAPQVAGVLRSPDRDRLWDAVRVLGRIGPAAAPFAPDVAALLTPEAPHGIKLQVVEALGLMGPQVSAMALRLVPLLKEADPELRAAAVQALDRMDARAAAPALADVMATTDSGFREMVIELLDRMAARGSLQDRGILLQCLAAARAVRPAAADFLLRAYVYRRNEPRDLLLIRWLGDRASTGRPQVGSLDTDGARTLLSTFGEAWDATRSLPGLHLEIAERIADLAQGRQWERADIERLDALQKRISPEQPAPALAVRTVVEGKRWQDRLHDSASLIAVHITAWLALILLYPRVRWVQSFFFWNKWARRFLGAGYVGVLITAVPWLRRRMFLPFRESLLPRALLEQLSEPTYFTGSEVRLERNRRAEARRLPLKEALPGIRGQVVLKGQSGLGKTLLLLRLAVQTREPVVLLRATECAQGVLAAIQKKLHGQLRDAGYLQALIHAGGLKVLIDGLNEASPDARARITLFVEEYFRGDFILTTQPIGWEPPATARLYVLQPLLPEQIGPFLLRQWEGVRSRATLDHAQYEAAVTAYVEALRGSEPAGPKVAVLSNPMQAVLAAEQLARGETPDAASLEGKGHRVLSGVAPRQEVTDPRLVALSNPMDASLAAELLARGETPDVFRLVEQRYRVMSTEFREREGRDFRREPFAEAVYEWRKSDQPDFRTAGFEAEVAALVRERLMLERTEVITREKGEEEVTRCFFRHDKIMEFFLLPAFLGSPQRREAHTQDEQFWGVYELLAMRLAPTEERRLQQLLLDQAADTNRNDLLNRYTLARLLASPRQDTPVGAAPLTA
jgi:HEAT repeat protein